MHSTTQQQERKSITSIASSIGNYTKSTRKTAHLCTKEVQKKEIIITTTTLSFPPSMQTLYSILLLSTTTTDRHHHHHRHPHLTYSTSSKASQAKVPLYSLAAHIRPIQIEYSRETQQNEVKNVQQAIDRGLAITHQCPEPEQASEKILGRGGKRRSEIQLETAPKLI